MPPEDRHLMHINLPNFKQFDTLVIDLKKSRQSYLDAGDDPVHLNMGIVLFSSSRLEGALESFLAFVLDNTLEGEEGLPVPARGAMEELKEQIHTRITNGSWPKAIEQVTGQRIGDITSNERWKAIKCMMRLRNIVAHGRSMRFSMPDIDDLIDGQEPTRLVRVDEPMSYLIDQGLVSDPSKFKTMNSLFSAPVADHLYNESVAFSMDVLRCLPEPYNEVAGDVFEL
jgi:hypothetical protein